MDAPDGDSAMTPSGREGWLDREDRVTRAFEALAERVQARVADLVSGGITSTNDVKQLHAVRWFGRPARADEQLVLSTMFRVQDGTLKVDCDLMQEDGPILHDLGQIDLGPEPTNAEIDRSVDAVVQFASEVEGIIFDNLETQDP